MPSDSIDRLHRALDDWRALTQWQRNDAIALLEMAIDRTAECPARDAYRTFVHLARTASP